MQTTIVPAQRALEFGIYRDGDNNLDLSQNQVLRQAIDVSAKDPGIGFAVEDTTSGGGGALHTNDYTIADGQIGDAHAGAAHDMASEANLARFVSKAHETQ